MIIPVYNGEKTIIETIESVLKQTFTDWELIIINDGSTDQTLDIVNRIQDSRIQVVSYPNAGLSASRNRGIAKARGEYISFIDADDLWTADKLKFQLKALEENPQAVLAYSWTDCIDESGQLLGPGSHSTVSGDVYATLLLNNFLENGSNPLIRTKVFTEVDGFDESLNSAEDWDMWLRLAARYPFVAVPFPHILYRVYRNSMSANVLRMEAASLRVIERAFMQAPECIQNLKNDSIANIYKYNIFKALQEPIAREQGLIATGFLWKAIKHEPALLKKRIIWKVFLKAAIVFILPTHQAEILLKKMGNLANITALFVHLRREP